MSRRENATTASAGPISPEPDRVLRHDQRTFPLQPHHLHRLVAKLGDPPHQRQAIRRPQHDHLPRRHPHDRRRPRRAPVGIGQHLRLVDHGDIHDPARMRHLHRAGDVLRARHEVPLLPGHQARPHPARGQRILELQRQQPQRRQRRPALRRRQPVQRIMRLARVRRPDHQRDPPLQRPRLREMRRIPVEPRPPRDDPVRHSRPGHIRLRPAAFHFATCGRSAAI